MKWISFFKSKIWIENQLFRTTWKLIHLQFESNIKWHKWIGVKIDCNFKLLDFECGNKWNVSTFIHFISTTVSLFSRTALKKKKTVQRYIDIGNIPIVNRISMIRYGSGDPSQYIYIFSFKLLHLFCSIILFVGHKFSFRVIRLTQVFNCDCWWCFFSILHSHAVSFLNQPFELRANWIKWI